MNVSTISSAVSPVAADINPESLAGNSSLSEKQKIAEASRQFEAMLLRQILSEAQKPVITSEFTDNSTAAGIYQDFIVNQMSDSLSKSGALGFAKIFEQQLSPSDHKVKGDVHQHGTKISTPSHHE
jgi:Rod binding domain-containing protein